MLYNIWKFLQLCLPYGILLHLYRHNKAVPANIQTKSGRILKAVMITDKYGILLTNAEYLEKRGEYLKSEKKRINDESMALAKEINRLSFEAREELFNNTPEDSEVQ